MSNFFSFCKIREQKTKMPGGIYDAQSQQHSHLLGSLSFSMAELVSRGLESAPAAPFRELGRHLRGCSN